MVSAVNRARIARKRADRLGLRLSQRGTVFTVTDENNVTLSVGQLAVVDAYLLARRAPVKPGPRPSTVAPLAWRRDVEDYLITLAAAGQRELTVRLRRSILCVAARGLDCPPADVTAEKLLDFMGRQQHLSPEARHSYRSTLRGFFRWAYEYRRVPIYLGDALPRVRVPKPAPRPASDDAWEQALAKADRRTELMLRLAAEAGLRRAEIAQLHVSHLDAAPPPQLLVHGKGGKQRIIPISDHLAELIGEHALTDGGRYPGPLSPDGWVFSNGIGDHLTANHVGKLISDALPGDWTHTHCGTGSPPAPTAAAGTCGPCKRCWATSRCCRPSATPSSATTRSARQRPAPGELSYPGRTIRRPGHQEVTG